MSDISNMPQTFVVWLTAGVHQVETMVEVPAGEDADETCQQVADNMIDNDVYTGWREQL
jgi:hypothetical protein